MLNELTCNPKIDKMKIIQGKPDSVFVQGEIDTVFVEKLINGSAKLKPKIFKPGFALFEKKINIDSAGVVDLAITTYPAADSISLKWFAELKIRSFNKTDTFFISRVDTLIKTKMIENEFYDSFWFGFSAASLIILIITLIC